MNQPAVFLDRDGVIVDDCGLVTRAEQFHILAGVPEALARLRATGFRLIVVTNQAVVARGLVTEAELAALHGQLQARLLAAGAPAFDAIYSCPHHPRATLAEYRIECECRKPRPGMLLRAAKELHVELAASYLIGDRPTDILAGQSAGCTTVLVRSSVTTAPAIETATPIDVTSVIAAHDCADLGAATDWILRHRQTPREAQTFS